MKSKLLLIILAFALAALMAFEFNKPQLAVSLSVSKSMRSVASIRCSPDWNILSSWIDNSDIPPIPGSGVHTWKINTQSDSAQFYFNQGINMYYAFHIIESMASFKKALRFDSTCAMLHWAVALALGPNINDVGYTATDEAVRASQKAIELSGRNTPRENALFDAQRSRYSLDSTVTRDSLNRHYVANMKKVYEQFKTDADVGALYADAMMLLHPWDLWNVDGTPKPWTPAIRQVLEKVLNKYPDHTGANHYYIHVMEPSPFAALAIPSADRLGKLTPALSHTVHMPSHIYLRTGQYQRGSAVNESAIKSYDHILPLYAPVSANDFLYVIHNLHMQVNHAMLAGQRSYSVKSAEALIKRIPADYLQMEGALGNVLQYIYMTPTLVDIRFGNWDELLNRMQPDSTQLYSNILYKFGRGMALAAKSNFEAARQELAFMHELMKDSSLRIPFHPFSPAIDGALVAASLLAGTISMKENDLSASIAHFRQAVNIEKNMVYNEPRDWLLNPKHFLGNALLKAGEYAEAKKVFEADLLTNNENGWALFGLWQTLKAEHRKMQAAAIYHRFNKAFAAADIKINSPAF